MKLTRRDMLSSEPRAADRPNSLSHGSVERKTDTAEVRTGHLCVISTAQKSESFEMNLIARNLVDLFR